MKIPRALNRSSKTTTIGTLTLLIMFLLCPPEIVLADDPAPLVLGRIVSKGTLIDGVEIPSGTTIFGQTEIGTRALPGRIHLESGQILELAQNSKILMELATSDQVKLTVIRGRLHYRNQQGVATSASEDRVIFLPLKRESGGTNQAKVGVATVGAATAGAASSTLLGLNTIVLMAYGLAGTASLIVLGAEPADHSEASPSVPSSR